jgi:hypothetical protein
MDFKEHYKQLKTNAENSSDISESDALSVYQFIQSIKPINKTLQIGLKYGELALALVMATGKLHIVVDPHQSKFRYLGLKNLKNTDWYHLIDFRDDYSSAVLPKLLEGNALQHFIIWDNDDTLDKMMNDFINIDLISTKETHLLARKSGNKNNQALHRYIAANRPDYVILPIDFENFILYKKIDRDKRTADFWVAFE